jgi:hypothetical protein
MTKLVGRRGFNSVEVHGIHSLEHEVLFEDSEGEIHNYP